MNEIEYFDSYYKIVNGEVIIKANVWEDWPNWQLIQHEKNLREKGQKGALNWFQHNKVLMEMNKRGLIKYPEYL